MLMSLIFNQEKIFRVRSTFFNLDSLFQPGKNLPCYKYVFMIRFIIFLLKFYQFQITKSNCLKNIIMVLNCSLLQIVPQVTIGRIVASSAPILFMVKCANVNVSAKRTRVILLLDARTASIHQNAYNCIYNFIILCWLQILEKCLHKV